MTKIEITENDIEKEFNLSDNLVKPKEIVMGLVVSQQILKRFIRLLKDKIPDFTFATTPHSDSNFYYELHKLAGDKLISPQDRDEVTELLSKPPAQPEDVDSPQEDSGKSSVKLLLQPGDTDVCAKCGIRRKYHGGCECYLEEKPKKVDDEI